MPKIKVTKPFDHCVGADFHPTHFPTGTHEVDDRTAEVAIAERWAKLAGKKGGKAGDNNLFTPKPGAPGLVSLAEALAARADAADD